MDLSVVLVAGALLLALVAVCAGLLLVARRDRARARAEAATARAETARLEQRLGELADRLDAVTHAPGSPADDAAAYLITDAGDRTPAPMLDDRLVLSAAVGEPLVKAVALSHGVRRALGAESRHRIRFAVRQESRRARKQRRREMREVWLAHKRAERDQRRSERAEAATAA